MWSKFLLFFHPNRLISELMECCIGIPRARATLITDNAAVQSFGQLLVFNFNLEAALNFGNVKTFETSPVIGKGFRKNHSIDWFSWALTSNIKREVKTNLFKIWKNLHEFVFQTYFTNNVFSLNLDVRQ